MDRRFVQLQFELDRARILAAAEKADAVKAARQAAPSTRQAATTSKPTIRRASKPSYRK